MGVFKTLLQRAGFCRSVFYWMRFHGSGRRGARLVTGPDTHKQRGSRGRSPRLEISSGDQFAANKHLTPTGANSSLGSEKVYG